MLVSENDADVETVRACVNQQNNFVLIGDDTDMLSLSPPYKKSSPISELTMQQPHPISPTVDITADGNLIVNFDTETEESKENEDSSSADLTPSTPLDTRYPLQTGL